MMTSFQTYDPSGLITSQKTKDKDVFHSPSAPRLVPSSETPAPPNPVASTVSQEPGTRAVPGKPKALGRVSGINLATYHCSVASCQL